MTADSDLSPTKEPGPASEPAPKPAPKPKPAAKPASPKPAPSKPAIPPRPPIAATARIRPRHHAVLISFVVVVLLPLAVAGWYLWARAVDQYASEVGFSVRSGSGENSGSELLGRLNVFSGPNSTDTDVLYQYIQSQELVERLDAQLDLRSMYGRYDGVDPIFAFDPDGEMEDLVAYWNRMVRIVYDQGSGLMAIRTLAFAPEEAKLIAEAIADESGARINELSAIARDDATRYAREDLDAAVDALRDAREAVTSFRTRYQMVDPAATTQGQVTLLNSLNAQLAEAIIEFNILRDESGESDPRLRQQQRRIDVIEEQIARERGLFGLAENGEAGASYAELVGEFERLNVDREFAEQIYRAALLAYDSAVADASKAQRYLAIHIRPLLAQSSRYPQRGTILLGIALALGLAWSVGVLIYYSIRDRR
jgi:capsular polysaccharide transport system permease protein